MAYTITQYLSLLVLTTRVTTTSLNNNGTIFSEIRQPRVSGRIVKLYSGTRPDPIQCTEDGFKADPKDCSVFYRCTQNNHGKFTVFRFQCGPGTVYDSDTEICNFPQNTKRSECGGLFSNIVSQRIPEPILNDNEIEFNLEQAPPSPILMNTKFNNKLTLPKKEMPTNIPTPFITITQDQRGTSPRISNRIQSSNLKENGFNDICTRDGFIGDSENCRKFYRCVSNGRGGYIKYEFSCSESTIWDDDMQGCNHGWAVKRKRCGRGNDEVENINVEKGININNDKITDSQTKHFGSRIPNKDKLENEQFNVERKTTTPRVQFIKDTWQSTKKAQTIKVSQKQTYGTDYNDDDNDSNDNDVQSPDTTSTTTTSTITSSTSNNKPSGSDSCSSSGFMGDPNNCKKFYRCVDNGKGSYTRYEFSCGEGTVWDANIEACNHVWAVKKCGKIDEQEAETTHLTQSTTDGNTYQSSTHSVSTTYQSSTHSESNGEDDSGYGNINHSSSSTESTVQSTEQGTSESDKICTKDGFFGDNNNCKKFYRCVDNGKGSYTKYEFSCGDGTVWDPKIEACNHEWAVENCGNSAQDVTKETSTTHKGDLTTEKPMNHYTTSSESNLNDEYDTGYGQQTNTQSPTSTEMSDHQDQTNLNKCTSAGFMGDDNDCKKFYRCVDNGNGGYTRYEFSCGEGTVWDPKIEACNHPGEVDKCGGKNTEDYHKVDNATSTTQRNDDYSATKEPEITTTSHESSSETSDCKEEGFMADKRDCKKFYRCVGNQNGFTKYEFTCGEGTVWDSEIQGCNHPSPGNKCRKSDTQHTESPHGNDVTEMTTEGPKTTKMTQKPNEDNNSNCKSEGFYANKANCKKFYRCVDDGQGGYTKYDFTCGDGTVWDQEIQSCNHPSSQNNCSQDYQTTSEPTSTSQQHKETTTLVTTEATLSATSSGNKDLCKSEGFFGNSNDCKKFYRCVDDGKGGYTKFEFNCGEGTVWVQEIQACDHDNDIGSCSTSSSNVQTDKYTTSSTSSPIKDDNDCNSSEQPTSSTTCEPSTNACTGEGFYANENDCRKFYRCVDDGNGGFTKFDFSCGEGTAWDSDIQACNHENEVKYCGNSNQSQQTNKEETSTQSNDCTQSTQSTKDSEVTQSTESTHSTQSSTSSSSGDGQSDHSDTCDEEGYFGNSKDCTKFYRCVDNGKGGYTKYEFTCGEGTIWDQDVQTCNHPGDVVNPSCQGGGSNGGQDNSNTKTTTQPPSTSSSASDTSQTQSSSATGTTQSSNCSQENSTSKPEDNTINCPKAGFYPNPEDCKKFYRCVDWDGDEQRYSVFHFDCGEGTIWDPELQTCNYEESVYPPRDCSSKQSAGESSSSEQTTEGTTETTTTESTTENEETTTKKSTTTTTTERSTTSEDTTTEQSTTTTEQSTTTTDQPTTTTEQSTTTTEQSTTTTEQSTTTTEQSTTTTEQSTTTSEQSTTTTERATTTDQTTAEQTTSTTEQTTTTSEQSTTEQSSTTTEESSTTTEQSTSTTEESTTDESTTEQSTTTTEQSTTTTEQSTTEGSTTEDSSTEPSSSKECPETDDDQYLYVCPTGFKRHPKYCNLFYQCTEDDDSHDVKVAVFHCPNNTIYDEGKTQCVEEKEADKKCDGEMAEKRRIKRLDISTKIPITVSKNKINCPAAGHYPFEKNDECSPAFLKCSKTKTGIIRGFVYRCPENHIYWSVSRRCEPVHKIRNCNNIDSSWNKRWEIPLETKNVAP